VSKQARKEVILDFVRSHRVGSQAALRELLSERGIDVTQATLSRDMAELRLVKIMGSDGGSHYSVPESGELTPPLESLLRTLLVSAESAGNLLVVRTMTGGAQAVGLAIDSEGWPEIVGTIAGDDTVLLVLRDAAHALDVEARLHTIASSGRAAGNA